jgi:hypothetical protein
MAASGIIRGSSANDAYTKYSMTRGFHAATITPRLKKTGIARIRPMARRSVPEAEGPTYPRRDATVSSTVATPAARTTSATTLGRV